MKQILHLPGLSSAHKAKQGIVFLLTLICSVLLPGLINSVYSQTYCIPSATHACSTNLGNETISNFTLDSINNNTTCSPINYLDYSSPTTYPNIETTLTSPGTYNYALTAEHADFASPYSVDIWIDLQNDGSFYDAGDWVAHRLEATDCDYLCTDVVKSGTLTIPSGVTTGVKRMRVRLIFTGEDENDNDPCDTIDYGEAEDYRVIVIGTVATNNISVGTISPLSYCSGSSISIPYTVQGSYLSGNMFTAQLSDGSGNFGTPVTLGSLTDTISGTISGTIPGGTSYGTGYVIRIVSSSPLTTGTVLSAPITITPPAPVSVYIVANPSGTICTGTNVVFTATGTNGGAGPVYQWKINGSAAGTNSSTYSSSSLTNNDTVECIFTSNAVCATGSPFTSNSIIMTVNPSLGAGTITAQQDTLCSGDQASLHVAGSSGNVQWQSSATGSNFANISGATDTSYSAIVSQNIFFRVYTSGGSCSDTSASVELTVNALPAVASLQTSDSLICSSDSTQICALGSGYTSYRWNTGGTGSCTYAKSAGNYWVTATAATGCSSISGHQEIRTYPVTSVSIDVHGDTLTSFGAVGYQWNRNDTILPGATKSEYIATQSGSYTVQVTDSNGCYATSSTVSIGYTAVNNLSLNEQVEIYPNPATGSFNIRYSGVESKNIELSMFNMLGERVMENLIALHGYSTIPVSISALPAGVYLVQLQSGQNIVTKRIVVE